MTTLIPKFDLKDGGATPTGAVNRPINEKLSEFVSVLDFGADPTGIAESTTAFTNAQTASKCVYVPEGTYLLDGLRIQNKVKLIGAGAENVIFNQKQASVPAIDCTSDVNSGGILASYNTRDKEYGNKLLQGIPASLFIVDARIAYMLNPKVNMRLELGYTYRNETVSGTAILTNIITFGLRSSFRNLYFDR